MSDKVLHIEKLSFGYPNKTMIFEKIDLSAAKGEVVLMIGENGSGKSTLLKIISGLLKHSLGKVLIHSKDVKEWDKNQLAQKLSYVASKENFNLSITVEEFIAFGRYPYSNWLFKQSEDDKSLVQKSMQDCGISYLSGKMINEISDGEKQKVSLARAIAQETEILLLDEPTTHLDIKSTHSILKLIRQQKEKGKCIVFSSHQVEKALKIADKVWFVDCGRVVESDVEAFNKNEELKKLVFGEAFF